jgi:hypothetical protein
MRRKRREHAASPPKKIRAHPGDYPSQRVSIKLESRPGADIQQSPKEGVTKRRVFDSSDRGRGFVLTRDGPVTFSAVSEGSPVINADSEWDSAPVDSGHSTGDELC